MITKKEKQDGQKTEYIAQLVAIGFQEIKKPQSDSPMVAMESLKMFIALVVNKDFDYASIDMRGAFLQGNVLDRGVYMKPPEV